MFSKTRSGKKSSPLARVLIVLALVLPVLGAAAYMWAMWDPKAYFRDIPLAVVSEDSGVGEGKEFTNYGDQIAEGMLELDYLNFSKTSPEEASAKLERGEYMMVVTIPEDSSLKAATTIDEKPVKPNIHFELNDYYGTQSAFITGSLIPELQAGVSILLTILFGFLAMALLAMLLPAVLRRRKSEGTSHSAKGVIGGYTVLLLASLAALGLLTIVSTSMGWQPASWSSALLVLVLIAAAGAAVYQFLRTASGLTATQKRRSFNGIV